MSRRQDDPRAGLRSAGRLAAATLALWLAGAAQAQTPIAALHASSDVTTTLGTATFADEDVLLDDGAGGVSAVPLGALPADADVEAYHREANGDHLLAFDTRVTLPGGLVAEARDVVRFDGAVYSLELDGSAHGLPADAGIDAVTRSAGGDLLLSFDVTVDVAEDEDLVRFDGVTFSPFFDASAGPVPVPADLDLDAAHRLANDHLLLSFDGTGLFPGFGFADEDLLELDPATGSWTLAFDASAAPAPWPAASDLDAVALPEPAAAAGLAWGAAALAVLARRRRAA